MIKLVYKSGSHKGTLSSLNIASIIHIKAIFITKLKNPKVIIFNGRVIVSNIGFTK